MEEMKVGEYVRDSGHIGKITGVCDCEMCQERGYLEPIIDNFNIHITNWDKERNFKGIKHSPNIIDLIEVGDYVNGKEVIMNLNKSKEWYNAEDDFVTCKDYTFSNEEIKTILTKEQYKANCYEV